MFSRDFQLEARVRVGALEASIGCVTVYIGCAALEGEELVPMRCEFPSRIMPHKYA